MTTIRANSWFAGMIGLALVLTACTGPSPDDAPPPDGSRDAPPTVDGSGGPSLADGHSARPTAPSGTRPDGLVQTFPLPENCQSMPGVDLSRPLVVERLTAVRLCLGGAASVVVTGNGAPAVKGPDGLGGWLFLATLATPLGDFRLRVTGTSAPSTPSTATAPARSGPPGERTGVLRVVHASRPTLYQGPCESSFGGATNRLELAGFAPRSTVNLYLYGPPGFRYRRTLRPAVVDANGEAVVTWNRQSDDPPGAYAVWADPPAGGCPRLNVER